MRMDGLYIYTDGCREVTIRENLTVVVASCSSGTLHSMKPSQRLSAALTAALLLDGALAATSGMLSILSMNVAGLPAILNGNDVPGDKTTNAATIGSKFAEYNYDVIHVQEVRFACLQWLGG